MSPGRPVWLFTVLVSVALACLIAAAAAPAAAAPDEVDSCTTISEPGEYVLTADVTDAAATEDTGIRTWRGNVSACIVVNSSDVTLRGQGHTVAGEGVENRSGDGFGQNDTYGTTYSSPVGVAVVGQGDADLTNVAVQNLTATDWFQGVLYRNVSEGTVDRVTATGNANAGVVVDDGTATVRETTARRNGFAGVYLRDADGSTVERSSTTRNGVAGVALFRTDDALVSSNTAARNRVAGAALVRSDRNRLAGNAVIDTRGDDGFTGFSGAMVLVNASDNAVSDPTVRGNRRWTYYSTGGASGNEVDSLGVGPRLSFTGTDVAVAPTRGRVPAPSGDRTVVVSMNATDTSDDARFAVDVGYRAHHVEGVDESTLGLYRYDGDWLPVPDAQADPDRDAVSADVSEFSTFALIGNRTAATATPTGTPSPTATASSPTEPDDPDATPTGTEGDQPGFGVLVALLALVAAALLTRD